MSKATPKTVIGNALAAEQDRGCVLVAGSYIEFSLEMLLQTKFGNERITRSLYEKLLSPDNPRALFGGLWAKTAAARMLGLIDDDLMAAIDAVRELRNSFAHTPGAVSLDDSAIARLMSAMKAMPEHVLADRWAESYLAGGESFWREIATDSKFSSARLRFMGSVILVNSQIVASENEIDPRRKEMEDYVKRLSSSMESGPQDSPA